MGICMTLAGRAAEECFFGRVTTGASDDLNKVTKIAYAITQIYGMGSAIGHLSFQSEPGEGQSMYRLHSEKTAQKIGEACMQLVEEAYERTKNLIKEKKALVEALGDQLLEHENLGHEEIVKVLGPRPFSTDTYTTFLKNTKEFADKYGEEEIKDQTIKTDRGGLFDGETLTKDSESEKEETSEAGAAEVEEPPK